MIVYQSTKQQFLHDADHRNIEDVIAQGYLARTGRYAPEAEFRSWKASLGEMARVLRDGDIPDNLGVGIEFGIPQTSKRIDIILSGRDEQQQRRLVIVELKQWSQAKATDKDGIIIARRGGSTPESEGTHPCYQAWSYAELLGGFNSAVYEGGVALQPCAYLHNYNRDGVIDDPRYAAYMDRAPLFLRGASELARLRDFIKAHVRHGDDGELIFQLEGGRIRPSKALADSVVGLLKGNREFVLVDDQKVAFETILAVAEVAGPKNKQVVIVDGGPGTGKSVLAVNLLARLTGERKLCQYVSKNAAPRSVYRSKLSGTFRPTAINNFFSGSGSFTDTEANAFDVLVVDEAHRLNEKSGLYQNLGDNQIAELIRSAQCTVFFVDDDQVVTLSDIGHSAELVAWARREGAAVSRLSLASQFRCNGSDGYLAWLDDRLGLRETANRMLERAEFDFRVFDSPVELHDAIRDLNRSANKARLVAGYCWDWKSKKDPAAFDIEMADSGFRARWNLGADGSLWIVAPNSVEQVGCIHTCQGLEVDTIGVIVGPDLIARDGQLQARPQARSRHDRSIRGWKKLVKDDPVAGHAHLDRIIRNTYRTLMTRGMKGCYIHCTDEETREYFRAGLARPT